MFQELALEHGLQSRSITADRTSQDGGVTGKGSDAADLLGEEWTRFLRICDDWLRSHPPSENWEEAMSPAERHSIHIGAFLHAPRSRELRPWDYDVTPQQSFAFASTGVDGEHYNVMLDPACRGVIVLTAPMAFDCPNVVVGESIVDFLGLAVVSGLSTIPGVAYRGFELGSVDIADAAVDQPDSPVRAVREGLSVESWTDIAARLQELADAYLGRLRSMRS